MSGHWRGACAGIALLTVWAAPAGAAEGEQLFKTRCTTCHTAKKAEDGVRKVEADQRQAHFEKFLASHYVPDASQRQTIVAYLIATVK